MSLVLDPSQPLVVATHNLGKLAELRTLLAPLGFTDLRASGEMGIPEPEETGKSFIENAILKASFASAHSQLPALADDSGLEVEALGGAPGIFSARWAGPEKDFAMAMQKIKFGLEATETEPQGAKARFVCVLALALPGAERSKAFLGIVNGTLTFPPRGDKGFGYDPIFIPEGGALTFAEMTPEEKDKISHRAQAFAGLVDFLKGQAPEAA